MASFYHIGRSFWLKPYILFIALSYRACCLFYQIMVNCSIPPQNGRSEQNLFLSHSATVYDCDLNYIFCHTATLYALWPSCILLSHSSMWPSLYYCCTPLAPNVLQIRGKQRRNSALKIPNARPKQQLFLRIQYLATQNKSFTIKKPLLLACKFFTNLGPPLMCIPI